jgi:hypothetical protein
MHIDPHPYRHKALLQLAAFSFSLPALLKLSCVLLADACMHTIYVPT